jgi:Tfp pilus assembly protein PilW
MGLFAILASIIIGAFVLILSMRTLVSNMNESQQKTRMALELVSRLARQANRVEFTTS